MLYLDKTPSQSNGLSTRLSVLCHPLASADCTRNSCNRTAVLRQLQTSRGTGDVWASPEMSNIYECYCLRAAIFNYMSESEKERVGLNKFIKIGGEKVSLYIRRKKNHKSFQISIYNADKYNTIYCIENNILSFLTFILSIWRET